MPDNDETKQYAAPNVPLFLALPRDDGGMQYFNLAAVESIIIPADTNGACIIRLISGSEFTIENNWRSLVDLMNDAQYSIEGN
jgi:hypothetical protein